MPRGPRIRAWAARITGERGYPIRDAMKRLSKLATDPEPAVRLEVATAARRFISGSLIVDTPAFVPVKEVITGPLLSDLWWTLNQSDDRLILFAYWMAVEPIIAFDPVHPTGFYSEDGAMKQMPASGILLEKIMRRAGEIPDPAKLSACILELRKLNESHVPAIRAALRGVVTAQTRHLTTPNLEAIEVIQRFSAINDPEIHALAGELLRVWKSNSK